VTAPARCALYLRVSTDAQVEKYGLPSQRRELHALVARRGYRLVGEFPDDGVSGATLERPQLTKLRDLVRAGGVDVVLAHAPDRIARELVHLLLVTDEVRRAGAKIEYVTHAPEDTAEGQFREQVLGAVAQLERAKIVERTTRGRIEKARRGLVPTGPVPYGYQRDASALGGLAIDATRAAIVRRIFSWLLEGTSVHGIVRRLRTQGIPSPRGAGWGTASVRRMLTTETYTGTIYYNRRTRPGVLRDRADWIAIRIPPLIARPTWDRAQAALRRNAQVLVGRPSPRVYLLKGLCRCRSGHAMVGQASHGRALYRCRARYRIDGTARCEAPSIGAVRLERAVWDAITATLRDPDVLRSTAKASRLGIDARQVDARQQAAELQRTLAELAQKRVRLLDLYLSHALDKPTFVARDGRLTAEEQQLRVDLARSEAIVATVTAEASRQAAVLKYCQLAARGLNRLDPAGRQALVRKLIDRIDVGPDRLEIRAALPVAPNAPLTPRCLLGQASRCTMAARSPRPTPSTPSSWARCRAMPPAGRSSPPRRFRAVSRSASP
jgi:site-specific DNA recombinase